MTVLNNNDIDDFLNRYPRWRVENNALKSEFNFVDFRQAMQFIEAMAHYADEIDHHPDWRNVYNRVEVTLTTYSKKSLTHLDVMLASTMERQYEALKLAA